jgi:serine/threonine-protein kinase
VVGRFLIEETIGQGGMSDVYRAFDPQLNRHVALKVLAPALGRNVDFTERFIRESQAAAQLNHPHVVPIFEAGNDGDTLFIAMQLVRGVDLKSYIATKGPLRADEISSVISQAAQALDHAHQRGLLHRDVKPANLLIEERGEALHVFLSDFGLTKSLGTDSRITHTGELVGSVHYVSPEHLEGRALDERSDVYSLGCVLYECISGRPPFERETDMAVLWAHLNAEIPPASRTRRRISDVVDRVVRRAMAKDPAERFVSCGALAVSLTAALQGMAHDLPLPVRKSRKPRTAILRSIAGVGAASLLLIGAIFMAVKDWTPPPGPLSGSPLSEDIGEKAGTKAAERPGGSTRADTRLEERQARQREISASTRVGSDEDASSPLEGSRGSVSSEPSSSDRDLVMVPTRTVKGQYDFRSAPVVGDPCPPRSTSRNGCMMFELGPNERFVDVVINDGTGMKVGAYIRQDYNGVEGWDGPWEPFCDATPSPFEVHPGALVSVWIDPEGCDGDSAATTGTITARVFRWAS